MKRHLLMALFAAIFAFAPITSVSYVHAEESYSDTQDDIGQQVDQESDQGEWITDEPSGMDDSEAYDPEDEESQEPAQ